MALIEPDCSFGYDQGMMGGVNTSPHYVDTMDLGYSTYEGESEGYVVTITNPTRQGGIVSSRCSPTLQTKIAI